VNADGRARLGGQADCLATGLAGVAGAVSFSHMSTLAFKHGQLGWKASAFPVSADGLELVASLYILTRPASTDPG
jgi:Protein of unknown function (DUF2637)